MANVPTDHKGSAPYIFISYAHKRSDRVLPIIAGLQSRGFRVWYDADIEVGTEWTDYIAEHIKNCGCFLVFITKEVPLSQHCRQEITYAISKDVPMLAVYLEETELPAGMEMQLGNLQAMFYDRHPDAESFFNELCGAAILEACRDDSVDFTAPKETDEPEFTRQISEKPADEALERLCAEGLDLFEKMCFPEAVRLFKEAADLGSAKARYYLGYCYENGLGVKQNTASAFAWYLKAADQNEPKAQARVGYFLENGIGVPVDQKAAFNWYLRISPQYSEGNYRLGMCYYYGRGVRKDRKLGRSLIMLAASRGHIEAKKAFPVRFWFDQTRHKIKARWRAFLAKNGIIH